MHIFVDEAGAFANPNRKANYVSCVASLIIPESQFNSFKGKFIRLKQKWGYGSTEVKGHKLSEGEFAEYFALLQKYEVILEASLIDFGLFTDEQLKEHQLGQAERITANLDERHAATLVSDVWELRRRVEALSLPLYGQFLLMTDLLWRTLEIGSLYYVQRKPKELSRFHWVFDAKEVGGGEFDSIWSTMVLPFIESRSLKEPFPMLEGANYKYFSRFDAEEEKIPNHLQEAYSSPRKPAGAMDIKKVFQESLIFGDSADDLGLQMVDLAVNALRRSVAGHLQFEGYKNLGSLMIRRKEKALKLFYPVDGAKSGTVKVPYASVIAQLEAQHKSMLLRDD